MSSEEFTAIVQSIAVKKKMKVKFLHAEDGTSHPEGFVQCSREVRQNNPEGTKFRAILSWNEEKGYYRAKKVDGVDLVPIN
ncbi:MAG: hypothetical protein INQ03_09390 [Candidatus Heimdallarchaeota archaeon]|nr:hypothetical protein [Candidatus Heimdallarchaeota archaeon]